MIRNVCAAVLNVHFIEKVLSGEGPTERILKDIKGWFLEQSFEMVSLPGAKTGDFRHVAWLFRATTWFLSDNQCVIFFNGALKGQLLPWSLILLSFCMLLVCYIFLRKQSIGEKLFFSSFLWRTL